MKRFKKEPNVSNSSVRSDFKEYTKYVLQIEDEAKLSEKVLRKTINSITGVLHVYEKKESRNLVKILQKSTRFNGVTEFDNDQVTQLHAEEIQNSWYLVVVTLTAIAVALPNIANSVVKSSLSSITEGLQFVKHIDEMLNVNGDSVKSRKAARRVWTEVEVRLQFDLQKKALKVKTSKEILRWWGDEAAKIVIQFKICKKRSLYDSLLKFLVANSMYMQN